MCYNANNMRESERRLRLLFDKSIDAMMLLENGRIIDCNEAAVVMMGCSRREELIGLSPVDISPEEQQNDRTSVELVPLLARDALAKGSLRFEWLHRRANGEIFPAEVSLTALSAHNEQLFHAFLRDISARRQAEAASREFEERYRIAIEHSNDAVALVREDKYIYVNRKFLDIFGYKSTKEIVERSPLIIVHPDDREKVRRFSLARRDGKLIRARYQFKAVRKDGTPFFVEASMARINYMGATVLLSYLRDVTERKEAEDELKHSEAQLRALSARIQSVREKERTVIAREIHDELGQALTGLKMDLSWLVRKPPTDQTALKGRVENMTAYVDGIIDRVRKISSSLRPGILDDLGLDAAIEWQARGFQDRTGIRVGISSVLKDVEIDRERSTAIFRIFQEALTNISRHAGATRVSIALKQHKSRIVLIVEDNGRGITPSEVQNPGSLGILGIRERARLFGGRVTVTGRSGKGTRVTAVMPLNGNSNDE